MTEDQTGSPESYLDQYNKTDVIRAQEYDSLAQLCLDHQQYVHDDKIIIIKSMTVSPSYALIINSMYMMIQIIMIYIAPHFIF